MMMTDAYQNQASQARQAKSERRFEFGHSVFKESKIVDGMGWDGYAR